MTRKKELQIMNIIEKKSFVLVNDLIRETGLSATSVRRYLASLEENGLINRTHGGASVPDYYQIKEKPISYKKELASDSKDAVARFASTMVGNGELVYIDTGSSMLPLYNYLANMHIIVVTPNIELALNLAKKSVRVYIVPGYVNAKSGSAYSEESLEFLSELSFDTSFISVTGITLEQGFGCNSELGTRLKRKVLSSSNKGIVLAEQTKYRRSCRFTVADFDEVTLVTDSFAHYLPKKPRFFEVYPEE